MLPARSLNDGNFSLFCDMSYAAPIKVTRVKFSFLCSVLGTVNTMQVKVGQKTYFQLSYGCMKFACFFVTLLNLLHLIFVQAISEEL